ncbi:sugar ABC transporter [Agrobacterium sp. 13-626]|nr:sugar ABC transporter [Agrobacterium sp. 13-626]
MKRSEINHALRGAMDLLRVHGWHLPAWANWTDEDRRNNAATTSFLLNHQMGWDVTDFGIGRFAACGLTLFCLRNGIVGRGGERSYAEKLLFIGEGQETPAHLHLSKMEDIINRGGGVLVMECAATDEDGEVLDTPLTVLVDGSAHRAAAWQPIELVPGQSITLERGVYHRFYAKPGHGSVLGGEVSEVNDDRSDNYFLGEIGRFAAIEENETPLRRLWNEEK